MFIILETSIPEIKIFENKMEASKAAIEWNKADTRHPRLFLFEDEKLIGYLYKKWGYDFTLEDCWMPTE